MTLTSSKGDKEFVRVICDYTYTPKDTQDPVSIKIGEEYWLIDKTNTVWWFVQNKESKAQLFVPAEYVEILKKDRPNGVDTTKGKTLAPKPKPRPQKTSTDEVVPPVMTTSDKEAEQRLPRTSSTLPQTRKISYENVAVTRKSVSTLQTDDLVTVPKILPEISSENAGKKKVKQNPKLKALESETSKQEVQKTFEKSSPAIVTNVGLHAESSSSFSSSVPAPRPSASENLEDEINYINLDEYRQMVNDNKAESETSDYRSGESKGGSRESLESKSCDTDSTETKEDLEKPDSSAHLDSRPKPVVNRISSSDYANLEDVQKSIRGLRSKSQEVSDGNFEKSLQVNVPAGWSVEEKNGEITYVNTADGEKWKTACESTGRKYFYNTLTNKTVWNLAEAAKSSKGTNSSEAKVDPPLNLEETEFPPLEPLPLKMVQKQGPLSKAKIDDQGKKSKKPSWSQSYAVLVENVVYFYKDQKVATGSKVKSISSLGKPELTLLLDDAKLCISPDEKKKEILVLTLSSGVIYHLHNENEEVLQHWKQSLENNIEAIKTVAVSDSKEIENSPVRPEMKRMLSYMPIFSEERAKIANRLLQWLKGRPSREALQLKGIIKDAVFGSSLTDLCEREKTKIPRFVHACLAAVEKRGLDVDGIYRISGNMSLVQKLRQMVDQNEFYDLLSPSWDVHTITGALKLFFRELSEPVFTFALFDEFLNAYRNADRAQKIRAYRDVIKKLPPAHKETMKKLFKHLAEVIRHGSSNRMQPQALAIVFGPTLLWPESKSKDVTLAASMVYQGQVVEFMIIEFKSIFS